MSGQGTNRQEVGVLGRKVGMTQVYDKAGHMVPVTVVEAGPCKVVQVKNQDSDGYNAIQIGFELVKKKDRVNKPRTGHFKKANLEPHRYLKELRQSAESIGAFSVGQEIKADIFQSGDRIDAVGTSTGKGFQGVFKRYNMHGGKASHGVHEVYRHGGSLGCRFPQHVVKGKHMAGHMGNERVTTMNLTVHEVRPEQNLLMIRGALPGRRNSLVLLLKSKK
jgi:large subunit ribosomal protein L3